ncbi:hypothetical protein [Streptomyces leeuwenhoekii]|uniref:DUF11 domain-containing protein n=1 Tax=Streptomyces leeuwenhoekii TaxID=1437453 RepID=A0A0F7VLF3_STRLW|nr:hypothetical protein [Streptomyces leeuwenhoekii]CQR59535.1 Hypothetical Protein sle_00730 [Streptomyces leeuwenhoekii]
MKIDRMYGRRLGRATAAVATAVALFVLLSSAQATALDASPGKAEFTYGPPQVSEGGDSVAWHWRITNPGDTAVHKVVMTHRLTPPLRVARVSNPCKVAEPSVRCEYGTLQPGQQVEGDLVADLPDDTHGTVDIKGRITWLNEPSR